MPNCFIAFDFGMRHVGVAVGQSITQTATPLESLIVKEGVPNWEVVNELIKKWQPEALIVGIPLKMDGSEQEITNAARKFSDELYNHYKIPVNTVDERLTTVEARAYLFAAGGYRALKKGVIDSMAAKIMLEDWLRTCSKKPPSNP